MLFYISFAIVGLIAIWLVVGYIGLKKNPDGPTQMMLDACEKEPDRQKLLEIGQTMKEFTNTISGGVRTFISIQFRTILIVTLIMATAITLFLESLAGIKFAFGAAMSFLGVFIGTVIACRANSRVTISAYWSRKTGKTVKVALSGGKIIGTIAHLFGAFGALLLYVIEPPTMNSVGHGLINIVSSNGVITGLVAYSLGYSLVAMFCRVSGGVLTKMADIGADIVGKVFFNMPEDDARNPATPLDNSGDILADCAANVADMGESYVATVVSALAAAVYFQQEMLLGGTPISDALFEAMRQFPIFLAVFGLLASAIGLFITIHRKKLEESDDPEKELNVAMYISAGLVLVFSAVGSYVMFGGLELPSVFRFGWVSPFLAVLIGIISAVAIGKITEYFTSPKFKPVQTLARIAHLGPAFVVTKGTALGNKSSIGGVPVVVSIVIVYWLLGATYGIPIAALGLMSFIGTTVSIDAFGPISDNAGGIAEYCDFPYEVRGITDACDGAGNTTAAIGKGFAISGAVYSTVSMMSTYCAAAGISILSVINPMVLAGVFVAGFGIRFFEAMLGDNTIDGAEGTADRCVEHLEKVEQGLYEKPEKEEDLPSNKIMAWATGYSNGKMVPPVSLCFIITVVIGVAFGVESVGGLQVGLVLMALYEALYMGNAGGAYDNAKKMSESGDLAKLQKNILMKSGTENVKYVLGRHYVEGDKEHNETVLDKLLERLFGKGSEIHKTLVICDTIGDTMKDVICVCLDIFIKMAATTSVILAPVFNALAGSMIAKIIVVILLVVMSIVWVYLNKKHDEKIENIMNVAQHEIISYFDRVVEFDESFQDERDDEVRLMLRLKKLQQASPTS